MIRIVLAVTNDIYTDNRLHKVASTLQSNGYRVTIVGRKFAGSKNLFSRPYKTRRFRLWFNKSMLFYANYNLRLLVYLLKVPVDIIVSNDLDTLLACWMASKLKRKVLLFDSHELFTEVPELIDRPLVKKIWHIKEKLLLPGVDIGYTVSGPIQKYFEKNYKKNFYLIRNVGLFRNDCSFKPLDKEIVVIYQGAVNKGRGLELMLEAMKYLENAKFWILGNGDIFPDLKELSKELGVEDKVIFFGRVDLKVLHNYTKQAHVGISIEEDLGLNYRYALPNKLFDYIQSRIPVIVSSLPEMKALVEKYKIGYVLEEREPKLLADLIRKFSENNEKQIQINQHLELAARDLCWQREEEVLIQIYRQASELIKGRNA